MATIKAGTYRFNDVLTAPSVDHIEQSMVFSSVGDISWAGVPGVSTADYNCIKIAYDVTYEDMWYAIASSVPDFSSLGVEYPITQYAHGASGWDNSLQTITIHTDQEVSVEFYDWFTANAVEQKQISGKWKWKDVINYSGSGLEGYVNFDCNVIIDGFGNVLFRCSLIGVNEALTDGTPVRVGYIVESSTPDISSALGVTFPIPIAGLYRGEWDTSTFGEGIKIIDFGTEPQNVSAEFYDWLMSNAVEDIDYLIKSYTLSAIADSIRTKFGKTNKLTPVGMSETILSIPTYTGESSKNEIIILSGEEAMF